MSDRAEQLLNYHTKLFLCFCVFLILPFLLPKILFSTSSNCLFNKSKISLGERILWCLKVEDLLTTFIPMLPSYHMSWVSGSFSIFLCDVTSYSARSSPRTFEQRFFWELYFLYSGYSVLHRAFFFFWP